MPARRIPTVSCVAVWAFCGIVGAGCGGGSPQAGGDGSAIVPGEGGAYVSCVGETRATPYTAGMQRTATDGAVTLTLLSSQPGPPIKGINTWTMQFLDGAGAPSGGRILSVHPYMPDHRHSSSIVPVITEKTDPAVSDEFVIDPLYLFMGGYWEITFDVTTAGGAADTVMFPICVPG